jgi:hypothetical protein
MSDEINDETTPMPEAPKGAAPSFDPKLAEKLANGDIPPNQDSEQYLADKGEVMSPEGLISAFRSLSETDNPGMAILVTELQELKSTTQKQAVLISAVLPMVTACALCAVIITSRFLAKEN